MLEPNFRTLLQNALLPPDGYKLGGAIATTYSLDLLTLLTAPLSFAMFEQQTEDGRIKADIVALLEALRRHAKQMAIFHQGSHILPPAGGRELFSYIEEAVVGVAPPTDGGVFHPKIWLLRFVAHGEPMVYRLLCATRNLTFDRSWDTMLVLEGKLVDRKLGYGRNRPLGNFIAALPGLALNNVPERITDLVELMSDEVRRVDFQLPDGFDDLRFWPVGIEGHSGWPFETQVDRMLIVSPFISNECLGWLTEEGKNHVLISRAEELQKLDSNELKNFEEIYVLHELAEGDVEDNVAAPPIEEDMGTQHTASEDDDSETDNDGVGVEPPLSGLHAKLFVSDSGWYAYVWTGSANATRAAFEQNVEFLVELKGKKRKCGIDQILDSKKKGHGFGELLQKYEPLDDAVPEDAEEKALEKQLRMLRLDIAKSGLVANVEVGAKEDIFDLTVTGEGLQFPENVDVRCRPISLNFGRATSVTRGTPEISRFSGVPFSGITSFFSFETTAHDKTNDLTIQFVLNLPLRSAPEDRLDRILRDLLKDPSRLLRILLLLLADDGPAATAALDELERKRGRKGDPRYDAAPVPLFESMVRSLDHDPDRLDFVQSLVEDLTKTEEGRELFPKGFLQIWEPIWNARRRLRK